MDAPALAGACSPSGAPVLPTARVKVRGVRGQALEMSEHARSWMIEQAATTGRVARCCVPAVFAVVFISLASMGLGMLLGVKGNKARGVHWQMPQVDWNSHGYPVPGPVELEQRRLERFPEAGIWSIPLLDRDELDFPCPRGKRCVPLAIPEHHDERASR